MNTEEDEFKRIEAEAKRRAARDDDDDTQDYVRGHYTAEQMLAWGKACAAAEREEIAKLADASVNADQYPTLTMLAQAIRMRGDELVVMRSHKFNLQKPWVGLTDEDWEWVADKKETSLDTFAHGAAWAADRLKERNT